MDNRDELILGRLDNIKESQREIKDELRELKNRLADVEKEVQNASRHSQIMTASVVGIALAVIYFVFTH